MGALRTFVAMNGRMSDLFDRHLLPSWYRVDGNQDFVHRFAPPYLAPGQRIIDVGGGKHPFVSPDLKRELGLTVIGLDIDADELSSAPEGAYDTTVVADVADYRGHGDADIVICQALLEHVRDNGAAFEALASMLRPGGHLLLFVPSRNAVFARLNLLLPQAWKRALLFRIFPQTTRGHGFAAYYDRCTPRAFETLAHQRGLEVEDARYYFISSYLSLFFPVYFYWRLWVLLFRTVRGRQAAETFSMSFVKVPA